MSVDAGLSYINFIIQKEEGGRDGTYQCAVK